MRECFTSEVHLLVIYKTVFVLCNTFCTLIMSTSSEKDISVAFEKLAITHSNLNANTNISHFKPKILEAIFHLKDINHKRPDLDSIIDFLTKTTTYNINKEALADLMKQNIIIKKKLFEISDTDNNKQQNEKDHKDNNKSNNSPAASTFI